MGDIIKTGLAWLTGQLRAHAATLVTYERGYDSVDVLATFGPKLLKLDDGQGGVVMEWTDMDFLIRSTDLDFGDGPVEPERGDLITVSTAQDHQTFEASPYGGEPVYRYVDPHQSMIRIHAKRVATTAEDY